MSNSFSPNKRSKKRRTPEAKAKTLFTPALTAYLKALDAAVGQSGAEAKALLARARKLYTGLNPSERLTARTMLDLESRGTS